MALVSAPLGYLLCGTPRTGSTLLCGLLRSTGIAGLPESYFREPDERAWARQWSLRERSDGSVDYDAFVQAARRAGTGSNDVFGARVMWGTQAEIVAKLRRAWAVDADDLSVLTEALGPLRFVYIRREDVIAQAVSWARAEQTAHWQDEDPVPARAPVFNAARIDELVRTIEEHNLAWLNWFSHFGLRPHEVCYERLIDDLGGVLRGVLGFLGLDLPVGHDARPSTRRQADDLSADWIRRYRSLSRL